MVSFIRDNPVFKRFVYISLSAHVILFLMILLSPKFPSLGRKRMIHYVNFISLGGGGGGSPAGGASRRSSPPAAQTSEELAETQIPTRETLRDLTTPPKLEEQNLSTLRHPVQNPKRERKQPVEKKAAIQKQESSAKKPAENISTDSKQETGEGSGSGVSLGLGSGSGTGGGFGSEFASQIGLSNFPFTYYLELLLDRISSNWLKSQLSSGTSDELFTTVYFKIYKDGKISVVEIEEKSGIHTLDMAAVRAVQSAAPFPPLPYEYAEEYLAIHLRFEHKK
jgi:TonB family protein